MVEIVVLVNSVFWPKRSNISYASAHISGCTELNHFLLCYFKQMVSTLSCYSFMLIGPSQLFFLSPKDVKNSDLVNENMRYFHIDSPIK